MECWNVCNVSDCIIFGTYNKRMQKSNYGTGLELNYRKVTYMLWILPNHIDK